MTHPVKLVALLEAQLQEYASFENTRKVLSHYGVSLPDDKMEKAIVILVTELKNEIHKWADKLPEDDIEAMARIERSRGPRGPRKKKEKKPAYDLSDYEVIEFE